jgi:hypothetical protein
MFAEPLSGWRHVEVTERRTAVDWAHQVRDRVDVHYPSAERIRLVMDNRNTHRLASLYEAFEPAEARRLAQRLEIHYTPKHGSWLNIAEIEPSRANPTVPRPPHSGHRDLAPGNPDLGSRAQCPAEGRRLAIDHYRGAHQAQAPVSTNSIVKGY